MTSFLSDSNTNNVKDPLNQWRQLTLHVTAFPNDFANHTQRIMLAMELPLQPYLSGAFQDFFIALRGTGRPLKEKMFHLASPLLEVFSRKYFLQWLEEDSDANLDCVRFAGSALVSTSCKKIIMTEDEKKKEVELLNTFLDENYDNSIDKAHYCIAYGCIDEARELLEVDLLEHRSSNRHSTEQELLIIYYYSHNKKALDNMSLKLLKIHGTLSSDWEKVRSLAKEW